MEDKMETTLTKEMQLAIQVALDELSNNYDWVDYLSGEEYEEDKAKAK